VWRIALFRRLAITALLTVALVLTGLAAPAPAAELVPPTRHERVAGLPSAAEVSPDARAPVTAQGEARVEQLAAAGARVSEPVRMPMRFNTIGFTPPADTEVAFRTSADGRTWTDWQWAPTLRDTDGPDPGGAEAAAALDAPASDAHWTGDAGWLQIRVLGSGAPEEVGVELIDTLGTSRGLLRRAGDALAAAWRPDLPEAHATVAAPNIVSRAGWGADESLRKGSPSYARRVRAGVVHHTAGNNAYTAAEAPAVVRGIYRYHTQTQGWSDIGYNLLVDRYGTVYEGRFGGLEEAVIGAHAGGFNTGTFGISVMGTFTDAAPPGAALDALVRAIAWKFDVHHLNVSGAVTLTSGGSTKFAKGTEVTLPVLFAHRDVSATACPGDAFYRQMATIRHRVLEAASDMFLDPDVSPAGVTVIDGVSVDGSVTATARLRPAGTWTAQVRDPDGTVVHTAAGTGEQASFSWQPVGVRHGTYTVSFASAGRRTAVQPVVLRRPEIRNATASPERVSYGRDGQLSGSITVSGDLWNMARWTITVDGPGGRVLSSSGVGARAEASWSGPATSVGTYSWEIAANDAESVSGSFTVLQDVLERVASQGDPITGPIAVSQTAFPRKASASRAVLAREDVFADAMAGGPLAGTEGPVLLTGSDELDSRVSAELERVLERDATVYVLGGEAALSRAVQEAVASRWDVVRLAGSGRVQTAAAVAAEVVTSSGATTAMIARAGPDDRAPWADALAGGAYGASRGIPVLLTDTERLSTGTRNALVALGITDTIVLGGTAAVTDDVLAALPKPRRVSGSDRAGTAAAAARSLWGRTAGGNGDGFVVTAGYQPDAWRLALAAAPLAAREHAPLLLVDHTSFSVGTREYLAALAYGGGKEAQGWALGSESQLSSTVFAAVNAALQ
jgi:putative cell wall-binding protein